LAQAMLARAYREEEAPLPILSGEVSGTLSSLPDTEDGPLWNSIKKQLYRSEVSHVKRLVGERLIQQNKLAWQEVSSLRQILVDFQRQNDELSDSLKQQVQLCGTQHRELLRRQAQLLLKDITDQVEAAGHVVEDVVPDIKDLTMRSYILGHALQSRSSSKGSIDGSPPATPSTQVASSRPTSSSHSGCSTPDTLGNSFGNNSISMPLGRQLGLEELAAVADGIREALEAEHEALLVAIGEQTLHLEEEATRQADARGRVNRGEPSTSALQQFVRKLQDLATSPGLRALTITGPPSPSASPPPAAVAGGASVRRLQALITQRRRASPPLPMALSAVPETPSVDASAIDGADTVVNATLRSKVLDPFFDDPFE